MKTCMVYPDFRSEKGISKFTIELIKGLRSQKIPVDEITYTQGEPRTFFSKLSKMKNYEIIHIQHEYNLLGLFGLPFFLVYLFLGIFRKGCLITTMHTVLSKKERFSKSERLKTFLRKKFYIMKNWLISKVSDRVVVYSKHFRDILVREYGFSPKQVVVLPLAMVDDVKLINKERAKKELKLKGKINLMIGTMNPYHDYEAIINQAKDVPGKILIVTSASAVNYRGTGKLDAALDSLRKSIKENNAEKKIELRVGFVPYEKWWKYFSAAELVLMPYKGGVGSGVFFDAILMRKPVIATKVPFFQSVEEEYSCVKTANPDQFPRAISESMKKKNYLKMKRECNRFVKENGIKPVSKKYKELYDALIC